MQWKIRPGPRRSCAMAKPAPRLPTRCEAGTRTPSYDTSAWSHAMPLPSTSVDRTMLYPGASVGTSRIENEPCRSPPWPSRTMTLVQAAVEAALVHHFRPSIVHHAPSADSVAVVVIAVGSLETMAGSVIAKDG
jgi:hypothetical protein